MKSILVISLFLLGATSFGTPSVQVTELGFGSVYSEFCSQEMKDEALTNARTNARQSAIQKCNTTEVELMEELALSVHCKLVSPFADLLRGFARLSAEYECIP